RTPSFLARRQQHLAFEASTSLMVPAQPDVAAGLAIFQNEKHWYFLGVRRKDGQAELFLEKANGGQPATIATKTLRGARTLKLKVAANGGAYSFAFDAGSGWQWLQRDDDGSMLSTDVSGGFVGATVGPYARAEGAAAQAVTSKPLYLDPDRTFAERAADLVSRMTLEEKVAQMQNAAPAIPRCSRRRSRLPRRSTRR